MAKLADAQDLKSCGPLDRAGSIPALGTNVHRVRTAGLWIGRSSFHRFDTLTDTLTSGSAGAHPFAVDSNPLKNGAVGPCPRFPLTGGQGVAGSNPVIPTNLWYSSDVANEMFVSVVVGVLMLSACTPGLA